MDASGQDAAWWTAMDLCGLQWNGSRRQDLNDPLLPKQMLYQALHQSSPGAWCDVDVKPTLNPIAGPDCRSR